MLPGNVLSTTPIVGNFLPPRQTVRSMPALGMVDVHYGGIAIGNPTAGLQYQLWTAQALPGGIYLSAPNTPQYAILPGVAALWVALAFDQNARPFIAWADKNGQCSYYWYDTVGLNYVTSLVSGLVYRPFATLDDARPPQLQTSDVIFAYVRSGELYFRAQRDRYGVEYDLGPAPASLQLAQLGMNTRNRVQFAFQNVQGTSKVPPAEFTVGVR